MAIFNFFLFWKSKSVSEEAIVWKCDVRNVFVLNRISHSEVFLEMSQNSQENICARVSFNRVAGLSLQLYQKKRLARVFSCEFWEISQETVAQVFSCEFWEISQNTFSYRTPLVAASVVKISQKTPALES